MQVISKFTGSNKIFFDADDRLLSETDLEIIERTYNDDQNKVQIKAFLLRGLMLHYTYYVFNSPQQFVVSFDEDTIINTFHLESDGRIKCLDYEPYLLCDEEFISAQYIKKSNSEFRAPLVVELFRIFTTPNWYTEILGNYGDTLAICNFGFLFRLL
jgi:hypothetical protein